MNRLPRVLVIGHYPLDTLDRAPKVRIYEMVAALARSATVTVIAGNRAERSHFLRQQKARGLKHFDMIYVETASSTATLTDIAFLRAAKRQGIPVAIYIRDAYQRFPDLYPTRGAKHTVLKWLYEGSLWAYCRYGTQLYFPTRGLSEVVGCADPKLLPPGGRPLEPPPYLKADPYGVIYVGAGGPHDGVDLLLEAFGILKKSLPEAHLTLVMRREEWPRQDLPSSVTIREAQGIGLSTYLWQASVAVIPRRDTAYNRLALPVKLLDYWSHSLPVVVTQPSEMADWVRTVGAGMAVDASPEDLAKGLRVLLEDPTSRRQMAYRAARAVTGLHHWDRRAEVVLELANRSLEDHYTY